VDRKNLKQIEVGIWKDPKTKELMSETKVKVGDKHQKIYRDWPPVRESLDAARAWRTTIKTQHKMKHPTMKLRSNGTWVVRLPATKLYQAVDRDFGYDFVSARDWAKESYEDRRLGKWSDGSETVESVWLSYLKDGKHPSPSTLHSYESIWDRDLKSHWGPVVVSDIGPSQYQDWIDGWSESISKLEHAHRVLRRILSHAVRKGLIRFNPAFGRELPEKPRRKSPAIPAKKLEKLLQHPARESDRLGLALALQTGLRFSEWSVLRVKDFDLESLRVVVDEHQARDRTGRTVILEGHKTSKESKTAGIHEDLAMRIKKLIASEGLEEEDFLFPAPSGKPWHYSNFRLRVWEPAREAAGIPKDKYMTGTHSTRRAAVTLAAQGGLTLSDIQAQTKHASTRIIDERYLQVAEEAEHKVANVVASTVRLPD
jgi:integrase